MRLRIPPKDSGFLLTTILGVVYTQKGNDFCNRGPMRRLILLLYLLMMTFGTVAAQDDGLNLPTELYVLLNAGSVQRYGLGAAGVNTVTPEGLFVVDFGIAPDGHWIAFRTPDGLMIEDIANPFDEPTMLEDTRADLPPLRGDGDTLTWSPAGDAIAYTTAYGARVYFNSGVFTDISSQVFLHLSWSPNGRYLAGEAENNVWWIFRRENTEMILTSAIPSSLGITWLDENRLVFVPEEGGLLIMDMANNNAQTEVLDSSWKGARPVIDTDGTILFFGKRSSDEEGLGSLHRVTPQPGSRPVEEGSGPLTFPQAKWARGGQLMLALQGGVLVLIEPRSAQGFTLPVSSVVSISWGPLLPSRNPSPIISSDAYFRAPDLNGVIQVWALPSNGGRPLTITPAAADVTRYAISPQGDRVAYASEGKILLHSLGSTEAPTELAIANQVEEIVFSPDGQSIAYTTPNTPDNSESGIWRVELAGGEPELILANGPQGAPPFYRHPQFAPNFNALLAVQAGSETQLMIVIDLNTGEEIGQREHNGGFWLQDGRIVVFGNGIGIGDPQPSEIIIWDVNTQTASVPLFTVPADQIIDALSETDDGNLLLATVPNRLGPQALTLINIPLDGSAARLGEAGFMATPQFSPDGTFLAGLTQQGGYLLLRDLQTNTTLMLEDPISIWDFSWRGQ